MIEPDEEDIFVKISNFSRVTYAKVFFRCGVILMISPKTKLKIRFQKINMTLYHQKMKLCVIVSL